MNREMRGSGRAATSGITSAISICCDLSVFYRPVANSVIVTRTEPRPMPRFSEAFDISKSQAELDFVDVPLETDIWLFIDPFAVSQRLDPWSRRCHATLVAFFQRIIDQIRAGSPYEARELLLHLQEPNETRFGLSRNRPAGAGIGHYQAGQLFEALLDSSAVQTGFLSSLEECELMIDGIARDKISDLTTNVIRRHLVEYTQQQCRLHNVPIRRVAIGACFDPDAMRWDAGYVDLPVWSGRPILLVPKAIARRSTAYDHQKYYRDYVLDYLADEELGSRSALVRTFKNGRRWVSKKDLRGKYPCTKDFLYRFSKDHPTVLASYRQDLARLEQSGPLDAIELEDEPAIAEALAAVLDSIPPGSEAAGTYHNLLVGLVEFLFYPNLVNPKKETEIHQGRKRIDILMENGARQGIFHRAHDIRKLPCAFVAIECKNYSTEVANPEIDQLAGRFSVNRGKLGLLFCRNFENRAVFVERCKDTLRDDRGLILPLDDVTVHRLLECIQMRRRDRIEDIITELVNEVWVG